MASDAATFAELNAALSQENYARAVEICNKIRAKYPEDKDAIKIKCVALIRLEKFDKALELAIKYPYLSAERVYCHYRLKQDDEALALLPSDLSVATTSPALLHLAAQLHFRKANYTQAIALYEQLLANAPEGEDVMELQTNLLAAYASAGRSAELTNRDIPIDDSFEIAFNKSFIAIENRDWSLAQDYLVEAERLCRETLEGASPADIDSELAIIRTQLAFVKQMMGDVDGALSDYRNVLKAKLSNQGVGAVASNNLVTIRKDRDLADSFKRLKAIESVVVSDKLAPTQQEAILANRALLLCLMHKMDECRESVRALQQQFPHSRILSEITVFLALQGQNTDEAIAVVQSDLSLGGRLGLAHLYLAKGDVAKAAECIDSIEPIRHTPGTVATLVALYEAVGNSKAALGVFQRALAFHKERDFMSSAAMKIREGDCAYKIQKKQFQDAAAAYLELIEGDTAVAIDPELRLQSLASLVIALSFSDATAAEMRCALLPPVPECDVDPVELEQQAQRSSRLASKLDAGDKKNERKRAAKNPEQIARKRAKRREAHLEKLRSRDDYNAAIGLLNPDPERWIPKKQRSYAKRGRRGRNRFVGAQGAGMGTEKDAAKLDAAARAAKKAEEEKKPAVVVSSDSSMVRKAKKKKRR